MWSICGVEGASEDSHARTAQHSEKNGGEFKVGWGWSCLRLIDQINDPYIESQVYLGPIKITRVFVAFGILNPIWGGGSLICVHSCGYAYTRANFL